MTNSISLKSILLTLIAIMVTSCQIPVAIPTPIVNEATPAAQTPTPLTVVELATPPPPTNTPLPEPTATHTTVPMPTAMPLPTETPIPILPLARLREGDYDSINVRSGPSTAYSVVASFSTADEAAVTGRNELQDWWQISLTDTLTSTWVFADLVTVTGEVVAVPLVEVAPPPEPTAAPVVEATEPQAENESTEAAPAENTEPNPEGLADELRCGKDFCVTFQELLSIGENGGCVGNHSIYITVLQGPPPGKPLDGVVIGDTYNNVEVASGSNGPGRTEITLWSNSMTLTAKRHIDGTPYTSEESFNFTAHDELIPPEMLAAAGYCEGDVEKCRIAHQNNQVCRGHYSWRVTFHKFD